MSINRNSMTNRDVHNRYAGENANRHISAITDQASNDMGSVFAEYPAAAKLFMFCISPFAFVLTATIILFKTVLRVPARFLFLGFVVNYLLYKPLTYFFEEYLNRNCPILFDPLFLIHVGANSVGSSEATNWLTSYFFGMIGSITAWIHFPSHLDQGLSLFVLFFSTVPWYFGKNILLGRPALRLYFVLNLFAAGHLIYKGYLIPALEGNIANEGALFLITSVACLAVCVTTYVFNPIINKAFSVNNLNALGESQGGLMDTITADNNLKTPIQS